MNCVRCGEGFSKKQTAWTIAKSRNGRWELLSSNPNAHNSYHYSCAVDGNQQKE